MNFLLHLRAIFLFNELKTYEQNIMKETVKINLNSPALFYFFYFYLKNIEIVKFVIFGLLELIF